MTVEDARREVVAALREDDCISGTRPYEHDVPHSHRSGRRIEPLISLQWFCDIKRLAGPAIEAVRDGTVRFHPEKPWTGVYLDWMENIRPWCISRQLWWGHQIPVWYRGEERYVGGVGARGRGLGARPGRARHLVLVGAVAVRDAGLARAERSAACLLPDQRALDRAGHHLPLGRPDDHVRDRVHGFGAVHRREHPLGRSRRPTDAACPSRWARASTRSRRSTSTVPTRCASAYWPCPRLRTCASPSSGCSRAATWPTSCGTPPA